MASEVHSGICFFGSHGRPMLSWHNSRRHGFGNCVQTRNEPVGLPAPIIRLVSKSDDQTFSAMLSIHMLVHKFALQHTEQCALFLFLICCSSFHFLSFRPAEHHRNPANHWNPANHRNRVNVRSHYQRAFVFFIHFVRIRSGEIAPTATMSHGQFW